MNIVLTGFMGTGKTAVGKLLAERLGWQFVDADALIAAAAGMTIPEIFAARGEAWFRARETETLVRLAAGNRSVIATGGGAVLRPENMDALARTGTIVCLTAAPEVIYSRLKGDDSRPLLKVPDPRARIEELLAAREPFYRRCSLTVDTSQLSPEATVDSILSALNR